MLIVLHIRKVFTCEIEDFDAHMYRIFNLLYLEYLHMILYLPNYNMLMVFDPLSHFLQVKLGLKYLNTNLYMQIKSLHYSQFEDILYVMFDLFL